MRDLMLPFRFYRDPSLLAENKPNREDAQHVRPFYVENNIIPAFEVAVPFNGLAPDIEFVIVDPDGNETDLTASMTFYDNIRILEGAAYRYIIHPREAVTYDAGCYNAIITVDNNTRYGIRFENLEATFSETWYRKINPAGDLRLIDEATTDKRLTQ